MRKPAYILLVILALFLIVYLLLIQKEKKTFAPGTVENFLELDSASVNRIEFKKYDTKMIFQRTDQQWYIVRPDSYRADNDAIDQLVSLASHMAVGEIISSNPEKQILFSVDSLTGTGLDFYSGERLLASVVVGKMSDDYMHAYLRKTGSEDVYLAKGIFTSIADQRVEHWRDRQLLSFDPQQVTEVELSLGEKGLKLTKQDTLWLLSAHAQKEAVAADNQKVQDYIKTLADMKADKFAPKGQVAPAMFNKPELQINVAFADGNQQKLYAIKAWGEGERYFVKTDRDNTVFVLFEYSFKRLAQKLEDFQPKEES